MDAQDKSDITNYLNYKSNNGRLTHRKNASMQKDLLQRLTTGSPQRIHTINYIVGNGEIG